MATQIEFEILHLDIFGQGVHKAGDKIYFIPQTLPSERGIAKVISKKRGVHFCQLVELTHQSTLRTPSPCPHYSQCNGCHYLHTSYQVELRHKQDQFARLLKHIGHKQKIETIAANQRDSYRNRIQLHYNKETKELGYIGNTHQIISIDQCRLPLPAIQQELQNLYALKWWTNSQLPPSGHVELSFHHQQIQQAWNQPYAASGFTQVNEQQNSKCLNILDEFYQQILPTDKQCHILDLFGGDGNLTQSIKRHDILVVDYSKHRSTHRANQQYIQANLFKPQALKKIKKQSNKFDLIVLDPPRSGFKELNHYAEIFTPHYIAYLSCNPTTLIRDLKKIIPQYTIDKAILLDFFPATYHWESLVLLRR